MRQQDSRHPAQRPVSSHWLCWRDWRDVIRCSCRSPTPILCLLFRPLLPLLLMCLCSPQLRGRLGALGETIGMTTAMTQGVRRRLESDQEVPITR